MPWRRLQNFGYRVGTGAKRVPGLVFPGWELALQEERYKRRDSTFTLPKISLVADFTPVSNFFVRQSLRV